MLRVSPFFWVLLRLLFCLTAPAFHLARDAECLSRIYRLKHCNRGQARSYRSA